MCHMIIDVTANHRLSSWTFRIVPFRSLLNTHTLVSLRITQDCTSIQKWHFV